MKIKYHNYELPFEPKENYDLGIKGILKLNTQQKEKYAQLEEAEDECWYLDDDGERLETKALLSASPWSILGPNGKMKLLCRFHDHISGEIWLNTEEGYSGELFKWLRKQ